MHISGKTVLLTGATGGLGHAIARELRSAGASLILTGRRADVLHNLATELDASMIIADLARQDEIKRMVTDAASIDILIANAGVRASGHIGDVEMADVDQAIDVNLRAPMMIAREVVPAMQRRGAGHLVFVGSIGAMVSAPSTALYNATKFGLRGFSLALRQDLHNTGVCVSVVEPGFVRGAGMFANSGVALPRVLRTTTPQRVARTVIRAIERNTAEAIVAPIEMRLGILLGGIAPAMSARAQRLFGLNLNLSGSSTTPA